MRLLFIGENCPALKNQALRLTAEELRSRLDNPRYHNTTNTALLAEVLNLLGQPPEPGFIEAIDRKANAKLDQLQTELNGSKANMIRESIRIGLTDLGDFFTARGDLENALQSYNRCKEYYSEAKNIVEMCRNYLRTSIDMKQYKSLNSYLNRALKHAGENAVYVAQIEAVSALLSLLQGDYHQAAATFLKINFEIGTTVSDIISPNDIAIYGGLCALATYDRKELKVNVIDNEKFKNFLELVPPVRELIKDFYNSRYKSCLQYLERLRPSLMLDLHMHRHVDSLYQMIRTKAIIQYFSPFSSADINLMAEAFNTPPQQLERELARLITDGHIQARIDSHNKILYASFTDQRTVTFQKALQMGEKYQRDMQAYILRCNLLQKEFFVAAPSTREHPRGSSKQHQ